MLTTSQRTTDWLHAENLGKVVALDIDVRQETIVRLLSCVVHTQMYIIVVLCLECHR